MPTTVKQKALKHLVRRDHARAELHEKLRHAGFAEDEIDPCLDEFAAKGWQSDARFALVYARHRARQGYGALKIRMELQAKGVTAELITEALNQEEIIWENVIKDLFSKKFHGKWGKTAQEKARQWRFFYQRGFSMDDIKKYLKASPLPRGEVD